MAAAGRSSSNWASAALSLLYPSKCCLCDLLGDDPLCSVCRDDFEPIENPVSRAYGPAALDQWARMFHYRGRAGQAVQRLKYSRATALARPMAEALANFAEQQGLLEVGAIVPVPIHWSRRCSRGFNQAELLCEAMPLELVRPRLLRRIRATRPQVGLTPEQRQLNLVGAFRAQGDLSGMRVLLVDDVLTSGQTGRECAAALKRAGAIEVGILAFSSG